MKDIDLMKLKTPVMLKGNEKIAYRDPAVLYDQGEFHLYFTLVETEEDGTVYLYTAMSRSRNLIDWTEPKKLTPRDRKLNFSSPGNIIRHDGKWKLTLQTYPRPEGQKYGTGDSRIWLMESDNLTDWTEPRLRGRAKGYELNVADEDSVKRFVENVQADRGTIHVLVNNAWLQHIDKVENFPLKKWNLLLGVMLTGPFLLTKYIVPLMKAQQYGRIINISSVHGKLASPFKSAYVSAKHGVVGLTRTVAIETANDGITVNAIMPGVVKTSLILNQLADLAREDGSSEEEALHKHLLNLQHLKRFIEPSEIAAAAIYLASDGAASVTGETLSVSGGM